MANNRQANHVLCNIEGYQRVVPLDAHFKIRSSNILHFGSEGLSVRVFSNALFPQGYYWPSVQQGSGKDATLC